MNRTLYANKINEYFKMAGLKYRYRKNDTDIYNKLLKYGSLEKARRNAFRIHMNHNKMIHQQIQKVVLLFINFLKKL